VTRLLADPPSRGGGILTKRELDAALRVLAALKRPTPASIVMDWDSDMQDMLKGLQRVRYVETIPGYERPPQKATAPYRPNRLVTTDLGNEYLDSIKKSGGASHARRKSDKQLDRDIAESLAASGQPQLADLFSDPDATKEFARQMRHELQTKQTTQKSEAAFAERPFTVKHMEQKTVFDDDGNLVDRKVRSLVGNFKTEAEARARADKLDGWVETRDGRVVYGKRPSDHAKRREAKKKSSRAHAKRIAYRIKLSPSEMKAVEFASGRYGWPDMLSAHAAEDGSVAFTESEMWQWADDVDADTEGGHSPFPLASPALADKLQRFYDERV